MFILDCPSFLSTQCCQCLWIVVLVCPCFLCPNVSSVSGLSILVASVSESQCCPVSLDVFILVAPVFLCVQCCQCLWIVSFLIAPHFLCCYQCLWIYFLSTVYPVSCVPNVASVSGLFILDCHCFLVCPMLPVSLDCVSLDPVSCVPNVASVSGLFILDCQFARFSGTVVVLLDCSVCDPVSCVPNVASVSGLLLLHLLELPTVSCVPNVASVSDVHVLIVLCLVYPMLPVSLDRLSCVLCIRFASVLLVLEYPMLPVSLDRVQSVIVPCVLCTQCCQCLWIVHS